MVIVRDGTLGCMHRALSQPSAQSRLHTLTLALKVQGPGILSESAW